MYPPTNYITKVIGLTLIELIISLLISCTIFYVIDKVYLACALVQQRAGALAQLQETGLLTTQILTRSLHAAGFNGCTNIKTNAAWLNHTDFNLSPTHVVTAYRDKKMLPGTQGFSVWYAGSKNTLLLQNTVDKNILEIAADLLLHRHDVILITNCITTEIVQVSEIKKNFRMNRILLKQPLTFFYPKNALVYIINQDNFYLRDTGRRNGGQALIALEHKDIFQRESEWLTGINNMQIIKQGALIGIQLSLSNTAGGKDLPWYIDADLRNELTN
jgi:hypothetical protein